MNNGSDSPWRQRGVHLPGLTVPAVVQPGPQATVCGGGASSGSAGCQLNPVSAGAHILVDARFTYLQRISAPTGQAQPRTAVSGFPVVPTGTSGGGPGVDQHVPRYQVAGKTRQLGRSRGAA
jgi:hypothetical protein